MTLEIDKTFQLFRENLEKKNLSPHTILAYTTDVKQLIKFLTKKGFKKISQVTAESLSLFQKELNKKGYSPVSCARKLNAYRKFFTFCKKENFIIEKPTAFLSIPKYQKPKPRTLSKMEYRALRDAARNNPRTAALIEVFLQTGAKVSEVADLHFKDIKKEKMIFKESRSSKKREIPLTPSLKKAFKRYLNIRPKSDCQYLFITKNNTPLLVRNMSTLLMRCFKEAGVKNASLNALRHTWIVYQLKHGLPLQLVSQLAGHKRVSTTAKYLDLIKNPSQRSKNKLKEL